MESSTATRPATPKVIAWMSTVDELIAQEIATRSARYTALVMGPAPRLPGNLTRRKDRSDLRIAAQSWPVQQQAQALTREIARLEEPDAVASLRDLHRRIVAKAIREGQPVPERVLAEYPELAVPA